MNDLNPVLRTSLIPLQRGQIILPSASVVEVLPYCPPEPSPNTPTWVLGSMPWRLGSIPVISMDTLVNDELPEFGTRSRLAVLGALGGVAGIDHYAILIQAVPRLVTLERKLITPDPAAEARTGILTAVRIAGQSAYIPDLGFIEQVLGPTFALPDLEIEVPTMV